jgi:dTDP-L-rhamnose 4-epimerase
VLNGQQPLLFEDGEQKRDFVSVYDVARAFRLAIERPEAGGRPLNISSGVPMTVREAAVKTIRAIGSPGIEPQITGRYRTGDIRHCFADISAAKTILGWEPAVMLEKGLEDLAAWLDGQQAVDRAVEARGELAARGLLV